MSLIKNIKKINLDDVLLKYDFEKKEDAICVIKGVNPKEFALFSVPVFVTRLFMLIGDSNPWSTGLLYFIVFYILVNLVFLIYMAKIPYALVLDSECLSLYYAGCVKRVLLSELDTKHIKLLSRSYVYDGSTLINTYRYSYYLRIKNREGEIFFDGKFSFFSGDQDNYGNFKNMKKIKEFFRNKKD